MLGPFASQMMAWRNVNLALNYHPCKSSFPSVMPAHNDISVKIQVDGADLPEFMVEKDIEKNKITWWVPAQTGKVFIKIWDHLEFLQSLSKKLTEFQEFRILVESLDKSRGVWRVGVKANGAQAYSTLIGTRPGSRHSRNVGYYRESTTSLRRFVFSPVTLVDDDDLLQGLQVASLGEVEVECHSVDVLGSFVKGPSKSVIPDGQKLHEKAKKGIAHHIGYGSTRSASPTRFHNHIKEHLATFVFRYRTLDFLQAQGVAPREQNLNNGQLQAGGSRKTRTTIPEDEDDDEIRELLKQVEQAKARKRKKRDEPEAIRKKVKQERKANIVPGGVIDLTI
ncbi:hypothetical protein NP233_g3721 [Leucocoprinus birnbaumii]|uniref:DUF7918 domain-containing protein n=1 Tax=Leucocoprinus birnbaumii TaxID=56174 RepID=A0AAD5YW78_9AGAR|nr:hypothetical protein NP233_g3721 [Leucocoprinus birnbaumii]